MCNISDSSIEKKSYFPVNIQLSYVLPNKKLFSKSQKTQRQYPVESK